MHEFRGKCKLLNIKKAKSCKSGRTPLTGGRVQRNFTRSPAWSFRFGQIRQRPATGTTSSLGNGQGRWSDFVSQQLKDTPDAIGQTARRRRIAWHAKASFLNRLTQFMMRPPKVLGTS